MEPPKKKGAKKAEMRADATTALRCVDALHATRAYGVVRDGPHHSIVVAPNPGHVALEEPVALDAMRYPGVLVPCDLRDSIQRVVDVASTLGARGAVTITGYCNGAAVAAYAAVCARACVALSEGHEPDISSVTFGIPIGTRVPCDAGTHYVSTRHTASMHPYALDTSHVRWVGEKDALYYANRMLGAFVRPERNEPLSAYADSIRSERDDEHADTAIIVPDVVVADVDSDWQMS